MYVESIVNHETGFDSVSQNIESSFMSLGGIKFVLRDFSPFLFPSFPQWFAPISQNSILATKPQDWPVPVSQIIRPSILFTLTSSYLASNLEWFDGVLH